MITKVIDQLENLIRRRADDESDDDHDGHFQCLYFRLANRRGAGRYQTHLPRLVLLLATSGALFDLGGDFEEYAHVEGADEDGWNVEDGDADVGEVNNPM